MSCSSPSHNWHESWTVSFLLVPHKLPKQDHFSRNIRVYQTSPQQESTTIHCLTLVNNPYSANKPRRDRLLLWQQRGQPYFCVLHYHLLCCKQDFCHCCVLCQQQHSVAYNIHKQSVAYWEYLWWNWKTTPSHPKRTSRRRWVCFKKTENHHWLILKRNSWDFSCFRRTKNSLSYAKPKGSKSQSAHSLLLTAAGTSSSHEARPFFPASLHMQGGEGKEVPRIGNLLCQQAHRNKPITSSVPLLQKYHSSSNICLYILTAIPLTSCGQQERGTVEG